ncbi:type VII secretion target [Nocardia sp. NPDC051832]|uniref:type VII secretion target n=1 Tax=Nocardia sp. NPDC051832 TaxID=3155673 RepID=UPI003424C955
MSETFKVDPGAVDKFAADLRALAEANANVATYLESWLVLDNTVWGDGGLIRTGLSAVSEAYEKLKPNYETLGTLTDAAATELTKVAQVYRTTDKARADELDRTYPTGSGR